MGYIKELVSENKTVSRSVYRSITELLTGERVNTKKKPATAFGNQILYPRMIQLLKEEGLEPKGFDLCWRGWNPEKTQDIKRHDTLVNNMVQILQGKVRK